MGKFKARYVVIPLIAVAVAGTVFGVTAAKKANDVIKVAPVSEASIEFGGYSDMQDTPFYGKLRKGSVASIKPNKELKIQSVNVKKGDIVKKGDVLITYDTHSLQDSVLDAELLVKTLTNEMTIADNELDVLRRLQPSENAPQEIEDEEEDDTTDSDATADTPSAMKFESRVTEKSVPLAGSGTAEDPLIYMAGQKTVLAKEYLIALASKPAPMTALFYVCDDTGAQLYARLIDGSKIDPAAAADYALSDGVTVTPDGTILFGSSSVDFASFITVAPSALPSDSAALPEGIDYSALAGMQDIPEIPELPINTADTDVSASYEISLDDNYKYSAQEIKDMIAEREKQKASLDLQKRQAELDVKKAKKLAQTGGETSAIDGKVTFVAKDIEHLSESGAYITVANDSGMSISATIGEFSLDTIEEGLDVTVTNFETGAEGHGVITEIDDSPIDQNSVEAMYSDSMESQYHFTVSLDETMDISEDSEVQLMIHHDDEPEELFLPKSLVRMEAGRSYVLIEGEDGRLKKQYVTIGQQHYEVLKITGGLSGDDMIAFPYGKAKVGSKTEETDFQSMYYSFGLFF